MSTWPIRDGIQEAPYRLIVYAVSKAPKEKSLQLLIRPLPVVRFEEEATAVKYRIERASHVAERADGLCATNSCTTQAILR